MRLPVTHIHRNDKARRLVVQAGVCTQIVNSKYVKQRGGEICSRKTAARKTS